MRSSSCHRRLHISGSSSRTGRPASTNPTFEAIGFHRAREGVCQARVKPLERCRLLKRSTKRFKLKAGRKAQAGRARRPQRNPEPCPFCKTTAGIAGLPPSAPSELVARRFLLYCTFTTTRCSLTRTSTGTILVPYWYHTGRLSRGTSDKA